MPEQHVLGRLHMDTTSISEMERQEYEALAALADEFPEAEIVAGCPDGKRYAVRVDHPPLTWLPASQWMFADTLPAVREWIVWALANR